MKGRVDLLGRKLPRLADLQDSYIETPLMTIMKINIGLPDCLGEPPRSSFEATAWQFGGSKTSTTAGRSAQDGCDTVFGGGGGSKISSNTGS